MSPSSSRPASAAGRVLERFEEAWQAGAAPRLEDFATTDRATLQELVAIDVEYRWRRSVEGALAERLRLEDYLARLPLLEPLPLDLICNEYRVRRRWGDRPSIAEYLLRFPERGAALQSELEAVDAALASEFAAASGWVPDIPVKTVLDRPQQKLTKAAELISVLQHLPILTPEQREALTGLHGRFSKPRLLAKELLQHGWLTPYQVNQLLLGRGAELVIGPYLLLERLGEGGTSQVFKARHQLLNREVTLKLLRRELLDDPEVLGRFCREIRFISQLDHPNVVRAFDAGRIGAAFVLVMEWVEGIDLAKLVREQGPVAAARACDFIRQAALGLQHAHEHGIVHRDIKPTNLLLAGGDVVKVVDLGLARLLQPEELLPPVPGARVVSSMLTPVGSMMIGTMDYMAPEQALDFHGVDERADIYGLGCTLFFLLTGQPPFPGGSMLQKALHHQQTEPPWASLPAGLPRGFTAVLRKMLAKRPQERFQDPGELARELSRWTDSGELSSVAPRWRLPRWPLPSRRTLLIGGLAAGGLLLGAMLFRRSPESAVENLLDVLDGDVPDQDAATRLVKEYLQRFPDRSELLRLELLRHGRRFAGSARGVRAAQLLPLVPGPLDRLGPIANTRLADVFRPASLVAVLGASTAPGGASMAAVAIAPDCRHIAGMTSDGVIRVWELPVAKEALTFKGTAGDVRAGGAFGGLAFTPDGGALVGATEKYTATLWSLATRRPLLVLEGHKAYVGAIAVSGNGNVIATGSQDGTLRLWDAVNGQNLAGFAHNQQVISCAVSGDGQRAVSGSEDTTARLWDRASGKELARVQVGGSWAFSAGFAPDGLSFASGWGSAASVMVRRTDRDEVRTYARAHANWVRTLGYSADGQRLISGDQSGVVVIWGLAKGEVLQRWQLPGTVRSVAFASDGRHVVIGLPDGTVAIVRLPT